MAAEQRDVTVDAAKGLCIIGVVMAHSNWPSLAPQADAALALVRMPAFFFLAGVFFSARRPWWRFVADKSDDLLKPYAVMALLLGALELWRGRPDALSRLVGALYGTGESQPGVPLWFLPALWGVYVLAWGVLRAAQALSAVAPWRHGGAAAKAGLRVAAVLGLLVLGVVVMRAAVAWQPSLPFVSGGRSPWLAPAVLPSVAGYPFSVDLWLLCLGFFLAGHQARAWVCGLRPHWGWALLALAVWLGVATQSQAAVNLYHRQFDLPGLALLAAAAGTYLLLCLGAWAQRVPGLGRALAGVGAGSLFVLIFHWPIAGSAMAWMLRHAPNVPPQWALPGYWVLLLLSCALAVVLPLLAQAVLLRVPGLRVSLVPLRVLRAQRDRATRASLPSA